MGQCNKSRLEGYMRMLSRAVGHHGQGNHPYLCPADVGGALYESLLDQILDAHSPWEGFAFGSGDGHRQVVGDVEQL